MCDRMPHMPKPEVYDVYMQENVCNILILSLILFRYSNILIFSLIFIIVFRQGLFQALMFITVFA